MLLRSIRYLKRERSESQKYQASLQKRVNKILPHLRYYTFFLWKYFNAMKMGGEGSGAIMLCFYQLPSHGVVFTLFCLPHRAPIASAMRRGWYEGSADSLFAQKAGEPDPTLQTGASRSIRTCCPEMTMLRVWSQREQETVLKIGFPFPHHANSCWSLQSIFSRQWTAFYSVQSKQEKQVQEQDLPWSRAH